MTITQQCRFCRALNSINKRFCSECGKPLQQKCKGCGASITADEKFCGNCGTPAQRDKAASRIDYPTARGEGERRQLTVLFCDLVGSTELTGLLDPEEYRDIVRAYDQAVSQVVVRYSGHVAQFQGDGIVAYFGWPQAQGDDAERAIRAGLDALEAVEQLSRQTSAPKRLAVRIGIHTGPVVIGDLGAGARNEITAIGETPNVAARVQSVATPSSVVITKATSQLVAGIFALEALGAQPLKGVARPLELYRVQSTISVRSRLRTMARLTPFVGREQQLQVLRRCWTRVEQGEGQNVLIRGEPGIGKSRLMQQFRESLASEFHIWLQGYCSPFRSNTPFGPVTDVLAAAFKGPEDESGEERFPRLENALRDAGLRLEEAVPLLAEMLQIPVPARYQPLLSSPEQKRKRLIMSLVNWILALARLQPVVIAVDDVQWIDPSSRELQQLLVEQSANVPIMVICTARPEFPSWPGRERYTHIELARLSHIQTREMLRLTTAGASLTQQTLTIVSERADGVPLFIEELGQFVCDNPPGGTPERQIPATLADSLMARLDRLGDAREIAQIASVLGREFSLPILREALGISGDELQLKLGKLEEAEVIRPLGTVPAPGYIFKHVLLRDAAYNSLLKSRRRALHRVFADTISAKFAAQADAQPEDLAYHLTEAGDGSAAAAAWQRAGERSAQHGALVEASNYYSKALELLLTIEPSAVRSQQEIALLMAHGSVLSATRGLASKEVETVYTRVRELGAELKRENPLALLGLWQTYITRGYPAAALALAEQRLQLALRENVPRILCGAHYALGATHFHLGNLRASLEHLRAAIGHIGDNDSGSNPFDVGLISMSYLAVALAFAGFSEQAREMSDATMAAVQSRAKGPTADWVLVNTAAMHQQLWQPEAALEIAQRFDSRHRLEPYVFYREIYEGWARAALGYHLEGAEEIRAGITGYLATGQRLPHAWFLSFLAWAYSAGGRLDLAEETLMDAWAGIGETGLEKPIVAWAQADHLTRTGADPDEIGAAWQEAIESARAREMKIYELRATVGLARLRIQQGRAASAREMLTPIYEWFREGFDMVDLKAARQLLG